MRHGAKLYAILHGAKMFDPKWWMVDALFMPTIAEGEPKTIAIRAGALTMGRGQDREIESKVMVEAECLIAVDPLIEDLADKVVLGHEFQAVKSRVPCQYRQVIRIHVGIVEKALVRQRIEGFSIQSAAFEQP